MNKSKPYEDQFTPWVCGVYWEIDQETGLYEPYQGVEGIHIWEELVHWSDASPSELAYQSILIEKSAFIANRAIRRVLVNS